MLNITSNTNWTILNSETWLTASSTSGTGNAAVTLSAQENRATIPRQAIVTISGIGVGNKTIVVTQEGTGEWQEINNGLNGATINVLTVDQATNYIYAGASGAGLFLSTDNGISWTAKNNGLSDKSVRSLAISGTNIFAGTSLGGVFLSNNNGDSWIAMNNGLSGNGLYVRSIAIDGGNILSEPLMGCTYQTIMAAAGQH